MTKRIIYTDSDGGVSIVIPAHNSGLTVAGVAEKDVPEGFDFEIVDTSTIPSQRTFRNAWVKNNRVIQTDMPKAREIAHGMRRAMRDEEMKPLDIQSTIPSETQTAEAERQLIRTKYATMQTNIDGSATEAALIAAMS